MKSQKSPPQTAHQDPMHDRKRAKQQHNQDPMHDRNKANQDTTAIKTPAACGYGVQSVDEMEVIGVV